MNYLSESFFENFSVHVTTPQAVILDDTFNLIPPPISISIPIPTTIPIPIPIPPLLKTVHRKRIKLIFSLPSIFAIPTKLLSIPLSPTTVFVVPKRHAAIFIPVASASALVAVPGELAVESVVDVCASAVAVAGEGGVVFLADF